MDHEVECIVIDDDSNWGEARVLLVHGDGQDLLFPRRACGPTSRNAQASAALKEATGIDVPESVWRTVAVVLVSSRSPSGGEVHTKRSYVRAECPAAFASPPRDGVVSATLSGLAAGTGTKKSDGGHRWFNMADVWLLFAAMYDGRRSITAHDRYGD